MLLAICLTVEAGCIKYRLNTEKYCDHLGSRNAGGMCCNNNNYAQLHQCYKNYYYCYNYCSYRHNYNYDDRVDTEAAKE